MSKRTSVDFSAEYLQWRRLRRTVEASGGDPFGVFVELSKVMQDDSWRTLQKVNGEDFTTFTEFVQDHWKGLGMEPRDLRHLLAVRGHTERRGGLSRNPGLFDDVRMNVDSALADDAPAGSAWHSTEDIALEVHRRHNLPIGVARRLVELEFLRLQDDVAVIRSHLTAGDREMILDAIAETVAEP